MRFRVTVEGKTYDVEVEPIDDASVAGGAAGGNAATPHELPCPIAGAVLEVLVKVGDDVTQGQPLMVIEALKVESNVTSPQDGKVSAILVEPGQRVTSGQPLLRF